MTRHNGYLSFTRLRAQFVKEVLSILRDPRSRMVVFMPPLLQLLVFAFAATLEVRNVDIAVHNQDAGRWSHELIARLDRADFITQVYRVTNGQELGRLIDQGKVIAALDIQPDFSRSAVSTSRSGAQPGALTVRPSAPTENPMVRRLPRRNA